MKKLLSLVILISIWTPSGFCKKVPVNGQGETSIKESPLTKQADNSSDLRQKRRMGVGGVAAGALGLGGIELELNLSKTWSFMMGYGGGGLFQSIQLQGKYALSGDWLIPYLTAGYTNWKSNKNDGPIEDTKPPVLSDRLLTPLERQKGIFNKHILYPGFGVQFLQLKGAWAGMSVFGEFLFLLDVESLNAGPTGGLGIMYYF